MQLTPAPERAPPWGAINVHLWWHPTPPAQAAPRLRRARLDALLRRVLARYLEVEPAALQFGREARGRPFLRHANAPDFNLSDTDGGTVIAVAARARIGVDLERLDRTPPHRRLARRYFSPRECDALDAMKDESARRAFLHLWTAKEASCKSTGTGIYGQLPRWVFDPGIEAPTLLALPVEAEPASRWQHLRVSPVSGYTAVLACDGWVPQVTGFELEED